MQTIKTAAIVVLMLTVLYGGYVSMTTPPEPLPDDVQDYLVIDESGIGDFDNAAGIADGLELSSPPPSLFSAGSNSPAQNNPTQEGGLSGSSFADIPQMNAGRPVPSKLPAIAASTRAIAARDSASYQSTNQRFQVPDPRTINGTFDPSKGTPFPGSDPLPNSGARAGAAFTMSDQGSGTAGLTSTPTQNSPPQNLGYELPQTVSNQFVDNAKSENQGLVNAIATADAMYAKGQLKEALETLSVFYGMPNSTGEQQNQLLSRLDPLAREVIYSSRHLLEQPYRVLSSETLVDVAARVQVPYQLLANINQIADPVTVLPGTELKMVRGPFRAEVDLTTKRLTLFLGDLYAGRFPIEVGNDPPPAPGTFTVQDKQESHDYYDRAGIPVPAGSPENPYGKMWLDLGGQICIHGSPNTVQPTDRGCISVAGDLADDVYGILSLGSSVTIRR